MFARDRRYSDCSPAFPPASYHTVPFWSGNFQEVFDYEATNPAYALMTSQADILGKSNRESGHRTPHRAHSANECKAEHQIQGDYTGDRPPNKRKYLSSAQSQPIPENNFDSPIQKLNKNYGKEPRNSAHAYKEQDSQLATPPETTKKIKRKPVLTAANSKATRLSEFRSLTITKPFPPRAKTFENDIALLMTTTNCPEWTTTQDTVQSNTNRITKTTLDNLAALRYKGSFRKPSVNSPDTQPVQNSWQLEHMVLEGVQNVLNENLLPCSSSPLGQSLWNSDMSGSSFSDPGPESKQASHPSTEGPIDSYLQTNDADTHLVGGYHDVGLHPSHFSTCPTPRYDNPTSSETQIMYNLLVDTCLLSEQQVLRRQECQPQPIPAERRTSIDEVHAISRNSNEIEAADTMHKELPQCPEVDDFNEGLDDADLLAIATSDFAPFIHPTTASKQGKRGFSRPYPSNVNQQQPTLKSDSQVCKPSKAVFRPPANVKVESTLPSSAHYLDLAEYSVDAEEEEEMLQLLDPPAVVVEPPRALPSPNQPLKVGLDNQKLNGSSVQFSSPLDSQKLDGPQTGAANSRNANGNSDNTLSLLPLAPSKISHSMTLTVTDVACDITSAVLDDSHEYEPLKPFVRPVFPLAVRDRCPIVGVSAQCFLRVCFRTGEIFREAVRCYAKNQDVVIEWFARVTFSSREAHTTKQNFQFADLWNNHPPFPRGILMNYKTTSLAERESRVFVDGKVGKMARCLGQLKKDKQSVTGWLLHITNIRETDWEEIRWTKRIVSAC